MAFFDPIRQTVTVRIVYDGLGTAGKTTNIRQIHALFTLARHGEIVVPEESGGRTLYFDWLELNVGFVDDIPLVCQVLTVPGQFAYVERRWAILRNPDAIVQVCDCSPSGVPRSRYAMRFLRAMLAAGSCPDVPLIVQANKQDVPGALRGHELAADLGLGPEVRIVEATAHTGEGVRATLVFALQAARDRARAQISAVGVAGLERGSESADELHHRMREIEEDDQSLGGARLVEGLLSEE